MHLTPGRKIDRYIIGEPIGEGAMAFAAVPPGMPVEVHREHEGRDAARPARIHCVGRDCGGVAGGHRSENGRVEAAADAEVLKLPVGAAWY